MDSILPILAAADFWEVVVGILFFVLYGIGQLVSARDQAKKKNLPRPRPLQEPGEQGLAGEMPAPPRPRNQEEALRSEVEDFLRRAQGQPPKREKSVRPPLKPRSPERPPRRLVAEQSRAEAKPRSRPRLSEQGSLPPRKGIAEHVTSHLSSKEIGDHTKSLGNKAKLAEARTEARIHEKFDQQLGDLQRQEKPQPAKPQEPSLAAEIVELLQKPNGMRQLIIAQEILRRPERW